MVAVIEVLAVGRRSTPQRLYEARRAGLLARLTRGGRMSEDRAEALVVAWEAEAASRGLERTATAFWRQVRRVVGGAAR